MELPALTLQLPEWAPPHDGEADWGETPRSPLPPGPGSLPSSPSARKTKSRAARACHRINSLRDAKVRGPPPATPPVTSWRNNRRLTWTWRPARPLPACPEGWPGLGGLPARHHGLPQALTACTHAAPSGRCRRLLASRDMAARLTHATLTCPTQVLVVSDMHRSESAADPALFQYHQHFEGPWKLVGKTHLSEVSVGGAGGHARLPGRWLPGARPEPVCCARPEPACRARPAQVFRVRHRASGDVFAVKRSRRRFRSKLQRERCLREIRAVAALPSHPNIVIQYRAWQEGGHFYIQMDYCEGGSLAQRAARAAAAGHCLPDPALWAAACQAAQGLAFLHAHGVMHLDVKPDNIYLSAAGGGAVCYRIGDFGLAVARDKDGSMVGFGTGAAGQGQGGWEAGMHSSVGSASSVSLHLSLLPPPVATSAGLGGGRRRLCRPRAAAGGRRALPRLRHVQPGRHAL